MKIDYAIMSSNNNPLYLDFWPLVSEIWKTRIGITPVLVLIDKDPDSIEVDDRYGIVHRVKESNQFPDYLYYTNARVWFASKCADKVCAICDIDMIPLSKFYFNDYISDINPDAFVWLASPRYDIYNQHIMNYATSKGSNFQKLFDIDQSDSLDDFLTKLKVIGDSMKLRGLAKSATRKPYWNLDEVTITKRVDELKLTGELEVIDKIPWKDGLLKSRRSMRLSRNEGNDVYRTDLLNSGYYVDYHSHRPYQQYRNKIHTITNLAHGMGLRVDEGYIDIPVVYPKINKTNVEEPNFIEPVT